MHFHTLENKEQ